MTGLVIAANGLPHITAQALASLHQHTTRFRLYLFDGVPKDDLTRVWNRGVELAAKDDCDHTVICNNDVLFYPGWLPPLLDPDAHATHAAIGPVTNAPGHQPLQRGEPGEPASYTSVTWSGPIGTGVALNGFCFCARTERFQAIPFDEEHWTFLGSDDKWMEDATAAWGLPFAIARHSYVHHYKSLSRKAHP